MGRMVRINELDGLAFAYARLLSPIAPGVGTLSYSIISSNLITGGNPNFLLPANRTYIIQASFDVNFANNSGFVIARIFNVTGSSFLHGQVQIRPTTYAGNLGFSGSLTTFIETNVDTNISVNLTAVTNINSIEGTPNSGTQLSIRQIA